MKKKNLALTGTMALGLLITFLVFSKVIMDPNGYLFSNSGDAVKSYYNFSYYLKYDEGIRHDGINYPYGDHLQYINSHPLYAQIIKFIDKNLWPIADDGVGILNLTMIFSLAAALPFLFLILRRFRMPGWYAGLVSLIILFLSPQVDRIGGHFEMVYAFFIPMFWYFLIRWHDAERKWPWTIVLLLVALTGGFTSAYYTAFLAIFPMAIILVRLWMHRHDLRAYIPEGLHLLLIAVLPLIMVKGLVNITDWVDDRPDNPWGFFIFHSNVCSIFLPPGSVLNDLLQSWFGRLYQWEGRSYVGLPAALLALAFVLIFVTNLFGRRKIRPNRYFPDSGLNLYLAASVIVLIFSMCIPFKWGMGFLTEVLPQLKQFRCLGRFSWIFYYVFTVFTATWFFYMFRMLRQRGFRVQAITLMSIFLLLWGLDATYRLKASTSRIFNKNEILSTRGGDVQLFLSDAGRSAEEFQAIFFLPYASTCGDKLLFEHGMQAFSEAMRCSDQTGIPLIQSFSPRISFAQAMNSIQLLGDSTIFKSRTRDMDQRPVLLVTTHEKLRPEEASLMAEANIFYEGRQFMMGELPVEAFNRGHQAWRDYADGLRDSLKTDAGLQSSALSGKVFYEGFETGKAEFVFAGKGAHYLKKGTIELFREEFYSESGDRELEISFWLYVDHRTDNMPTPELFTKNSEGKVIESKRLNAREIHNTEGMWVRVAAHIRPEEGKSYILKLRGRYITVDELLVRATDSHVLTGFENGAELFDNFYLHFGTTN